MQAQKDICAWVTSELELERSALQIRHERIIQGLLLHMNGKSGHPGDAEDAVWTVAESIPVGKDNDAADHLAGEVHAGDPHQQDLEARGSGMPSPRSESSNSVTSLSISGSRLAFSS
eukprot:TRINITY_DN77268_c0_g1_i1.p1 TRINITY_DN77268_c0_g1~~TRINITY_DN77268_c0_g1_i1.p1  ORF type:complete len:117 (+),score=26.47 TRINITY_DN77268_c0_g1_i1:50-400(+)